MMQFDFFLQIMIIQDSWISYRNNIKISQN